MVSRTEVVSRACGVEQPCGGVSIRLCCSKREFKRVGVLGRSTSPNSPWETAKVVLSGEIISFSSYQKKTRSTNRVQSRNKTLDINSNLSGFHSFLNNINLPKRNQKQSKTLNKPLRGNWENAILSMPNNKAPGSDGYPAKFYKHLWDTISPLFFRMLAEIKATSHIPPHVNSALISVLLKPNKDPTLFYVPSPVTH